jgi:hypothetical protein
MGYTTETIGSSSGMFDDLVTQYDPTQSYMTVMDVPSSTVNNFQSSIPFDQVTRTDKDIHSSEHLFSANSFTLPANVNRTVPTTEFDHFYSDSTFSQIQSSYTATNENMESNNVSYHPTQSMNNTTTAMPEMDSVTVNQTKKSERPSDVMPTSPMTKKADEKGGLFTLRRGKAKFNEAKRTPSIDLPPDVNKSTFMIIFHA